MSGRRRRLKLAQGSTVDRVQRGSSRELPNVRNASEVRTEIGGGPSDNDSSSQDEACAVVRKLSPVEVPTYLEQIPTPDGGTQLLVVERIARGAAVTDDEAAEYVRDAHAVAEL